jgi:uncharacterized protein YggE
MKNYLILFSLFLLIAGFVESRELDDFEDVPKLTLTGQATLQKPADELNLSIGVVNRSANAQDALTQNSVKMQAVIDALEALGLTKADYQTGHFSITPTYTPYPKNPPPDWRAAIDGYEVNNSILIKTDKLGMAGQIIDTAIRAGANDIQNIHFSIRDLRKYWDEALAAATQNAFADAKVIADAAGVKIRRVLSIALNNTQLLLPKISSAYLRTAAAESVPPVEPGDVNIQASVTVVFEIE